MKVMQGQSLGKKTGNVNPAVGMFRVALIHNPGGRAVGLTELCKMVNPEHRSQKQCPVWQIRLVCPVQESQVNKVNGKNAIQ